MQNVIEEVSTLVKIYGEETVANTIQQLIGGASIKPGIPASVTPIIAPEKLQDTVHQLDASVSDIIEKAAARETVYGDKVDLLKKKRELETAIELKESEAYMSIRGESRSQYAMVGNEKVLLTNEESRKAFARNAAATERKQLAKVDGELMQIEQKAFWKKDEYEAAVKAGDRVQAKASLQAGLLHMLGARN